MRNRRQRKALLVTRNYGKRVADIVQGIVNRGIARRQSNKQRRAAKRKKDSRLEQEREPLR